MAKLPKIPYEITNQIYASLCEFGCARWKALHIYAEALAHGSDALPEDIRSERAEGAGMKAIQSLINEGYIKKMDYADEHIVVPVGKEDISFLSLTAFEAFAELVREIADKDQLPQFCYPGKTDNYPFHFIIAASMQKTLYRVIVYGQDAISRLGFFNGIYSEDKDKHFVTLLVVPETYDWQEFSDVYVRGRTRIAFVEEVSRKNKTYRCILTDTIVEK